MGKLNNKTRDIQLKHREYVRKHIKKSNKNYSRMYLPPVDDKDIEWINLDKKESLRGLTESEVKDLNGIRKLIDLQARGTIQHFKKHNIKRKINKELFTKTLIYLVIITFITIITVKNINNKQKLNDIQLVDNSSSIINIEMNNETNKLDYEVESIHLKIDDNNFLYLDNTYWLNNSIDTNSKNYNINNTEYNISKDTQLSSMVLSNDMVYIQRNNIENTASKEFILSKDKPNEVDDKSMQKIGLRFKEKSNPIQIKSACNSYFNTFLMLSETLAGGSLNIKSLKTHLVNTESLIRGANKTEGIIINLDELGSIQLSKFNKYMDNESISYSVKDDILKIRNSVDNTDYISISCVNNEFFGCNAEDLIATTNEKVFVHMNYDNAESIGYKTIALISDTNLYCFRFFGESAEELRLNLFEQLGIDLEQIEIKKVQRVIDK